MATRRTMLAVASVVVLAALAGCSPTGRPDVHAFVDEAVAAMDAGIHADSPEWRDAVADAKPRMYARASIAETYGYLRALVQIAGGPHSAFFSPEEAAQVTGLDEAATATGDPDFPVPTTRTEDGITVLYVPDFIGIARSAEEAYRDAGVAAVDAARPATTCGWIIDIRGNGGGNVWPMLAVVAPFLDDGRVFGFEHPDGDIDWTVLEDGAVAGSSDGERFDSPGFHVDQPVMLATSVHTGSSAELVAIAFAGQEGVLRVGGATHGFTTGNEWMPLSDGSAVNITTVYDIDRTGQVYDGPLQPDVAVALAADPDALGVATERLRDACS